MSNPFEDITSIGGLQETPNDYWDHYELPGGSANAAPVPPGRYVVEAPFPGEDFKPGATKKGAFQYEMNAKIVEGEYAGRSVNFLRFPVTKSAKRQGSLAGDLLIKVGSARTPKTNTQWAEAAQDIAGRQFGLVLDLDVYDKNLRSSVFARSADIPKRPDGSFKTVFVKTKDGVLISKPDDPEAERLMEQQALDQGGYKLYANNRLVAVISADEARG